MNDAALLRQQFEVKGLTVDDETAAALSPVYAGLRNGAQRLATLDLGEREPSITFRHPPARKESRR